MHPRVRFLLLFLVFMAALGFFAWVRSEPTQAQEQAARPTASFRRPRPPSAPPRSVDVADHSPERGREAQPVQPEDLPSEETEPTVVDLFDLPEATLDKLMSVASARMEELSETCGEHVAEPLELVCLMTIDEHGLLELTVQPTVLDLETIWVDPDGHLPEALVRCLDNALWEQDWSGVIGSLEPGTSTQVGLSMKLGRSTP